SRRQRVSWCGPADGPVPAQARCRVPRKPGQGRVHASRSRDSAHPIHARGLRSPATGLTPLHDAPPIPRPLSRRVRSTPFSLGGGSMRTIALAGTLLVAATLTMSCSDVWLTAPVDRGFHPAFDFTSGPSNPGPVVVRLAGVELAHVDNDPSRGLMMIQTPTSNNPLCGGTASL